MDSNDRFHLWLAFLVFVSLASISIAGAVADAYVKGKEAEAAARMQQAGGSDG